MSCMSHVTPARWINLLLSSRQGARQLATKSHLRRMTPRTFENMVKSDKVVIFSKSNCSYSDAAKNLFRDINMKYTAYELDRREDGHLLQIHLGRVTGSVIMPRIFITGTCIGGYCELMELFENGRLVKLINRDI